eukprot:jgi/Mesen1/6193/ME000032S05489
MQQQQRGMFVDALDHKYYNAHRWRGECPLGSSPAESKHCYCRLLERLVNVWAYHSGRRFVRVDRATGAMAEAHPIRSRRGRHRMWSRWFDRRRLKAMDEDRAEEADEDRLPARWLWPHTGEVFWQGSVERERLEKQKLKVEKARRRKERLAKRSKYKQRALGRKYKPHGSGSGGGGGGAGGAHEADGVGGGAGEADILKYR